MQSVHVVISGWVQGVGFRNWCVRRARELGLSGWVRNRRTGEVEAVFCGVDDNVRKMLDSCKDGPSFAKVDLVEVLGEAGFVTGKFEAIETV